MNKVHRKRTADGPFRYKAMFNSTYNKRNAIKTVLRLVFSCRAGSALYGAVGETAPTHVAGKYCSVGRILSAHFPFDPKNPLLAIYFKDTLAKRKDIYMKLFIVTTLQKTGNNPGDRLNNI